MITSSMFTRQKMKTNAFLYRASVRLWKRFWQLGGLSGDVFWQVETLKYIPTYLRIKILLFRRPCCSKDVGIFNLQVTKKR